MRGRDITHARLDAMHDLIEIYRVAWDAGSHHNYERHMLGDLMTGDGPTEKRLNAYVRRMIGAGMTDGFIMLKLRGRLDLTVEWLVSDITRTHHAIWDKDLVEIANARLDEAQGAQGEQDEAA